MRSEASYKRQKEHKKIEYYWYAAHHICVQCHQNNAVYGMKRCGDCLYKKNLRHIRQAELEREQQRIYAKKKRATRKELGLCADCGKPAIEGHIRCTRCTMIHRLRDKEKRVYVVRDRTKCLFKACDEPVVEGKCYCEKHYQFKRDVMMRNRQVDNKNHIWRKLDHEEIFRKVKPE